MSNFSLEQLTEGIRERHLGTQNSRLLEKWSRTGLLRGLDGVHRENMARMLENQASQVLREASDMGAGTAGNSDIRGFSNIAFPIVRRVFGGLIANDLVSIQPMSLPSGLLFYLDYTYGDNISDGNTPVDGPYLKGESIYNNPKGKGIRSGSLAAGGQYDLAGAGYSRARISVDMTDAHSDTCDFGVSISNADGANPITDAEKKLVQFDPQVLQHIEDGGTITLYVVPTAFLEHTTGTATNLLDKTMIREVSLHGHTALHADSGDYWSEKFQGGKSLNLRRLNQLGNATRTTAGGVLAAEQVTAFEVDPLGGDNVLFVMQSAGIDNTQDINDISVNFVRSASVDVESGVGSTITVPGFESDFTAGVDAGDDGEIPEIDIKIESIAVTAVTRKLRAKWTPELAQDLNAYHSLDAEVELTQILSEQIALEIDREILGDLLHSANAANFYWSRAPGKFVNKESGAEIARTSTLNPGPAFTGTVREWYETLTETIIDVANQIHRKTLRGSANFIVVGPDVATILESSVMYRPSYSLDGEGQVSQPMSIGADKVGTLSNRFTVYKDPYFPRNKVLVGYKGGSYLESGYVYAPYVPLIVTPTIFAPEDFTPRKGVMTRYGKKMVRSDFFGTVTCMDMNII
jgi:hypothetical protein